MVCPSDLSLNNLKTIQNISGEKPLYTSKINTSVNFKFWVNVHCPFDNPVLWPVSRTSRKLFEYAKPFLSFVHTYSSSFESATFASGFKNFPVHTLSDSLRIYYFPLWKAE